MPDFTFRQLEYFSAVAEHGTIAGASAALHVSESAVSAALGELERALGTTLAVRRRAHGITLTTEGRDVLAQARGLLLDARELQDRIERPGLAGQIAVGCYDTMAATVLPRLVRGFSDEHPDVRIEASDGPQQVIQQHLESGELDVAILYDRDIEGTPVIEPLFALRAHVLVSQRHPLADRETVSFAELVDEPFIRFDLNPSWQHTRSLMSAQGVVPRERYRTGNLEHARSLVGQGLGYTVLVQRPASDVTHDGSRVRRLEITPPVTPVRVVIARRSTGEPTRRAAAFIEYAKATFADGLAPA